jgi:DHA1 family tetracycline resistance protein-like MFS transporter
MRSNRSPALGFIFVTLLIDITGWGIIIPVMPKLIIEVSGLTPDTPFSPLVMQPCIAGGSFQPMPLCSFFVRLLWVRSVTGMEEDPFCWLRCLVLVSIIYFSPLRQPCGGFFLGRIIAGVMGASFTTAGAYIADISTAEKRAQNFGIIGVAFGLGFIIGPVIGGLLGGLGTRVPFLVTAGLCLINWLYGFFILPESLKPEKPQSA